MAKQYFIQLMHAVDDELGIMAGDHEGPTDMFGPFPSADNAAESIVNWETCYRKKAPAIRSVTIVETRYMPTIN